MCVCVPYSYRAHLPWYANFIQKSCDNIMSRSTIPGLNDQVLRRAAHFTFMNCYISVISKNTVHILNFLELSERNVLANTFCFSFEVFDWKSSLCPKYIQNLRNMNLGVDQWKTFTLALKQILAPPNWPHIWSHQLQRVQFLETFPTYFSIKQLCQVLKKERWV